MYSVLRDYEGIALKQLLYTDWSITYSNMYMRVSYCLCMLVSMI